MRLESKRVGEIRDYLHDWSPFLGEDTISSSDWTATGVDIDSDTNTADSTTVWVSGGTIGVATLTNTIVTSGGRTEVEVFTLPILSFNEPVDLVEMKRHLRKTDTDEDALIQVYISSARRWVENYTGHILVRREVSMTYRAWGDYLRIPKGPVVSISEILYTETGGSEVEYDAGVLWQHGNDRRIYPPYGSPFPTLGSNPLITATILAGYAAGNEPEELRVAIMLLAASWYTNRSAISADEMYEIPLSVKSLCMPARGAVMA